MARYYAYRTEWGGLQTAYARAWPQSMNFRGFAPSKQFEISTYTLNQIEDFIQDLGRSQRTLRYAMNFLVQVLSRVQQGYALEMSRGPAATFHTAHQYEDKKGKTHTKYTEHATPGYSSAAWKIPVRRITSHYFMGWTVRRLMPGVWMLYNPTREAYYIEYGIHPSKMGVRRPINKMSMLKTLQMADSSRLGHRVWQMAYGPIQATSTMGQEAAIANSQFPIGFGMGL